MRFTFRLISTLCVLFFASSAYAASLVAIASPDPVSPGGMVQITLVGTTDPLTETTTSIDVRIVGFGTQVSTEQALSGTCIASVGCLQGAGWTAGGTQGTNVGGNYIAFSQIGGLTDGPITNGMAAGPTPPFLTGNSTLTAVFMIPAPATPGVAHIMLSDAGVGFFGISGSQILGSYGIPEPTTAALMGLGLLGLAASGRKR
ncbi:MAG: PEP-CTERM sorting domain-containing protein [Myxococcota bacterium]